MMMMALMMIMRLKADAARMRAGYRCCFWQAQQRRRMAFGAGAATMKEGNRVSAEAASRGLSAAAANRAGKCPRRGVSGVSWWQLKQPRERWFGK